MGYLLSDIYLFCIFCCSLFVLLARPGRVDKQFYQTMRSPRLFIFGLVALLLAGAAAMNMWDRRVTSAIVTVSRNEPTNERGNLFHEEPQTAVTFQVEEGFKRFTLPDRYSGSFDDTESLKASILAEISAIDSDQILPYLESLSEAWRPEMAYAAYSIGSQVVKHHDRMLPEILHALENKYKNLSFMLPAIGSAYGTLDAPPLELLQQLSRFKDHPTFIANAAKEIGARISQTSDFAAQAEMVNRFLENREIPSDLVELYAVGVTSGFAEYSPEFAVQSLAQYKLTTVPLQTVVRNSVEKLIRSDQDKAFSMLESFLSAPNNASSDFLKIMVNVVGVGKPEEVAELLLSPAVGDLNAQANLVENFLMGGGARKLNSDMIEKLISKIANENQEFYRNVLIDTLEHATTK